MSIYDVAQDKVVASFDNVSTSDYENEHNGDFARYTFYIANNFVANDFDYQIKLSFGPTERSSVTDIKLPDVSDIKVKELKLDYDYPGYTTSTDNQLISDAASLGFPLMTTDQVLKKIFDDM
jgi:hypothetical protein